MHVRKFAARFSKARSLKTDATARKFVAAAGEWLLRGPLDDREATNYSGTLTAVASAGGDKGCSHEWWHKFQEKGKNEALRAHAHMKMCEVAYFLHALDRVECREPNGRTIRENSLITISTEFGDGQHNDVKRELSCVFHAVADGVDWFPASCLPHVTTGTNCREGGVQLLAVLGLISE